MEPSAGPFLFRGCPAAMPTYARTCPGIRNGTTHLTEIRRACVRFGRVATRRSVFRSRVSRSTSRPPSCRSGSRDPPSNSKSETPSPGLYLHSNDSSAVGPIVIPSSYAASSFPRRRPRRHVLFEDARRNGHALKFHLNPVSRVTYIENALDVRAFSR